MLAINCPRHGTAMLLTERRVRSIRNTANGIELTVECYCGHVETIHTGRARGRGQLAVTA